LVVVIIVLFNNLFEIFVLPVSFAAAYLIYLIYLIPNVRRKLNFSYYVRNKIKYHNSLKTIISLIIIEILSLSYVLIDRYYVGEIDPGGISALNYSFVIFSLKIIFNYSLVNTYQQNGLAASTTLIYFALFLFGFIILSFKYRITSYQLLIISSVHYLINALIAFMVVLLIRNFINGFGYISNFVEVLVFIFVYILNSYILSDDEYRLLKNVSLKFLKM